MTSCIVFRCPGAMLGQMIACAPHWTFLSEDLRLEVVAAWDQLALERQVGNPRRATRDQLAAAKRRAVSELDAAQRQLEAQAGQPLGADGRRWLREQRRLEAMPEEVGDAAEA